MKCILILTLVTTTINGMGTGVTTAEFSSKESCERAGKLWLETIIDHHGYPRLNVLEVSSYLCVEK